MPNYTYQCEECGLKFCSNVKMEKRDDPQKCPECHTLVYRQMPDSLNGQFHLENKGMGPQNTGVSAFDQNADRVIGQAADSGWKIIRRRNDEKTEVLKANPGAERTDLSRNPDGSYRVLSAEEKAVQKRALEIDKEAKKALYSK